MTARRQARSRTLALTRIDTATGATGVPRAFLIGRCVEVWGDPALSSDSPRSIARIGSTKRRFGRARSTWLAARGVSEREGWQVIPAGAPWTLEDTARATDRLSRAGCTLDDLPALIAAANDLFAASLGTGALSRAYRRSLTIERRPHQ